MKSPCLQIFRKTCFAAAGILLLFCISSNCKNNNEELIPLRQSTHTASSEPALLSTSSADFVKGADISHVTRMEDEGKFFFNTTDQQDLFIIMKERGLNTIRIRVWVNSTGSFLYNSL